jgi:hypothetical protein
MHDLRSSRTFSSTIRVFGNKLYIHLCLRFRLLLQQIHKHGGTVQPTFDTTTVMHIVTETNENHMLRVLGLKRLSEIPLEIPTMKWSWVISGKPIAGERDKQQMDYEYACCFSESYRCRSCTHHR